MSTLREEFEAWFLRRAEAELGLILPEMEPDYDDADVAALWEAWKASRAALVVEMPDIKSTFYPNSTERARAEEAVFWCRNKILDAGIKVKP